MSKKNVGLKKTLSLNRITHGKIHWRYRDRFNSWTGIFMVEQQEENKLPSGYYWSGIAGLPRDLHS